MYLEYIKEWKKYRQQYGEKMCFLLLVGKFYELYDILDKETQEGQTNMKQATEILGIQLSLKKGDGPNGEDCYFSGFPEQSLQKFVTLLTRENWTVVVTQQQKNTSGKVTGRPVERVFSPGTHIESAGADAPYLAALWLEENQNEPPSFAAVVLDLTTGLLESFEGKTTGFVDSWISDELVNFFQIFKPRELIVYWRGDAYFMPTESFLRMRFELSNTLIHRHHASPERQGTLENDFVRTECLKRFFTEQSLLSIHEQVNLRTRQKTERCMVSLLLFAEEHIPSATKNITRHQIWTPSDALYLGNHSLVQLNYITLNQEESVFSLFQKAITSLGRRTLRLRMLHPSSSPQQIERKLKEVDYAFALQNEQTKALEIQLRLLFDISRLHRKIMTYSCDALDILSLNQSYEVIRKLIELIGHSSSPFCFQPWESDFEDYLREFLRVFDIDKARRAVNGEDISFFQEAVAPQTKQVEDELQVLSESIAGSIEKIRQWVGLPEEVLTLESKGEQGFLQVAIKKTAVKLLKDKIQRDGNPHNIQIHVRQSVKSYIEYPQMSSLAAQYERKKTELLDTMQKELPGLCKQCMDAGEEMWPVLEDWVGQVDSTLAIAKVSKERNFTRPTILVPKGYAGFRAEGLRHPLLESAQTRVQYVKHNVSLGFEDKDDKGWLLYGMNASGKSSLMKSMGIAVLLAQAGCYVPATTFRLYPFKSLLTRILNQDNIWAGLSSFAVEMSELRDIFSRAESHSLVLGDELCSGTESVSATSLVAAGIQYLKKQGTRFVFATHLHGLDSLDTFSGVGVWHLRCHYDAKLDRLVYDRTLHPGSGETTYGIEVARAMHIPMEIIENAFAYRRKLEGTTNVQEAKKSHYNANLILHKCDHCKEMKADTLEVHHIEHQKTADESGRLKDGSHKNNTRNLIVLCQSCHKKHHRNELEIGPVVQTDKGEVRTFKDTSSVVSTREKEPMTNQALFERYLRENPKVPLKVVVQMISSMEGIQTSEAILRSVRKKMIREED